MKMRSLWKTVCTVIASVCIAVGLGGLVTVNAKAATPTFTDFDITEKLTVENRIADDKNYAEFFVKGSGVNVGAYYNAYNYYGSVAEGKGARWVLNSSTVQEVEKNGCDLLAYIEVNGKSVRDIINTNTTAYPAMGTDAEFKNYTPVMVNAEGNWNGYGFHFIISKQYIQEVNGGVLEGFSVTFKKGITWYNVAGQALKTTADKAFTYYKGAFVAGAGTVKPTVNKDTTATTTVAVTHTEHNGCAKIAIDFGISLQSVYPLFVTEHIQNVGGFFVNDHPADYGADVDMMEYILLNGKTLRSIVKENSTTKAYKGEENPMHLGGVFAPVSVQVAKTEIRLQIMSAYCAWEDIRLTLKSGFSWTVLGDATNNYTLRWTENIHYGVKNGRMVRYGETDSIDLLDGLQISSAGEANSYQQYAISFAETFTDTTTAMTDEVANAIEINGKSVSEINAESADTVKVAWVQDSTSRILVQVKSGYAVEKFGLEPFAVSFMGLQFALPKTVRFMMIDGAFVKMNLVTFDGGEIIEVLNGDILPQTAIPEKPVKASDEKHEYIFRGWYYLDEDGEEYIFKPTFYPVQKDIDLYPKFETKNREYTVTLLNADGTPYDTKKVGRGEKLALPSTPEKEHYTGSWQYQGEGKAPLVMPTGDIAYKASYTPTEYTVTFYKNPTGTAVLAMQTYTVEDKNITVPEVGLREGYAGSWSAYELVGGDIEVRPVYEAVKTEMPVEADEGCGSVVWGMPAVATVLTAVCLAVLKKKERGQSK